MADASIVFIDIAGSTEIFGALGNIQATKVIAGATQWIGRLCEEHGGRVIKFMGDGVLVLFQHCMPAVEASVELQMLHTERQRAVSADHRIKLKVGVAHGDVVEKDGHCFGDVVNVASGLSVLASPAQILVTDAVVQHMEPHVHVHTRKLGQMGIRGRSEPCVVHQIDWQREETSAFVTVQAALDSPVLPASGSQIRIVLSWQDTHANFTAQDLPLYVGRVSHANFVVNQPRVSRLHAKVSMRADQIILEDVSTFGTSVRFEASNATVALRRQACVLVQGGVIALGAAFDEENVPIVRFDLMSQ
jgi:class 3 adenylate cyclase